MKKLLTLMFLLVPAFAFADDSELAVPEKKALNNYITLYVVQSNRYVDLSGSWSNNYKFNGYGLGYDFGFGINKNLYFDLSGFYQGFSFSGFDENNNIYAISLTPGLRYEREFFGFLRPYVGVGAGLAVIVNEHSHNYTSYTNVGNTSITKSGQKQDDLYKYNFAYQINGGLIFGLTEKYDLNLGVKYQNLGGVSNGPGSYDITGSIRAFSYRVGIASRF